MPFGRYRYSSARSRTRRRAAAMGRIFSRLPSLKLADRLVQRHGRLGPVFHVLELDGALLRLLGADEESIPCARLVCAPHLRLHAARLEVQIAGKPGTPDPD